MNLVKQFQINNEEAMLQFAKRIAAVCPAKIVCYLIGDLGAGKTTLVRGILRGFGYEGAVKSPTYTLVEHYQLTDKQIYHFDLYRLVDPQELEFMGAEEFFSQDAICFIEWPAQGSIYLPSADLSFAITSSDHSRKVQVSANTKRGQTVLQQINYL